MAGSNSTSTREKLLGLVDDIELITKEIFENAIAPKAKRLSAQEHEELTTLLIQKDAQLKETMNLAGEQGDIDKKMKSLQAEVQKQDNCIKQLQKQLKDAETLLSTAIYQARQKLDSIQKAKENPVSSEELIKYAHRISASNAVSAPLNWQQGDPRRPYPTDIEMRLGLLGRSEQIAIEMSRAAQASGDRPQPPSGPQRTPVLPPGSGHMPPHMQDFHSPQHHMGMGMHPSPSKMHGPPHGGHHPPSGGPPFHWGHGQDMPIRGGENMDQMNPYQYGMYPQMAGHGGRGGMPPGGPNAGAAGTGDDVEVMSTDSSSSSSTDSN